MAVILCKLEVRAVVFLYNSELAIVNNTANALHSNIIYMCIGQHCLYHYLSEMSRPKSYSVTLTFILIAAILNVEVRIVEKILTYGDVPSYNFMSSKRIMFTVNSCDTNSQKNHLVTNGGGMLLP